MKRFALFSVILLVSLIGPLAAQEPSRGPDGGTTYHVSGVEMLNIPGKPFAAKTSTEWTRTLADGSTITTRLEANLARDSRGRVYRERRSFVPANSDQKPRLNEIMIYDPVSHTQTVCAVRAMACIVTDYAPRTFFETRPAGPYANGARSLTRESIGTDTIEGIFVLGTRETTTTNAGVIGNEQPIVATREFWYSEELQNNLAVTRINPEEGKQVIRLSDIRPGEPDPHMFEVPIGYSVSDRRRAQRRLQ
jgi:hypothetical protein